MYNGFVNTVWNVGLPYATMEKESFLGNYNGSASEYTSYIRVNPVDLTQNIPDCSTNETGPSVIAEVTAPSWLHQYIFGVGENYMEKISKQFPHIQIVLINGGRKIVIEGPNKEVQIVKEVFDSYIANLESAVVVEDVHVKRNVHSHIIGKKRARVERIQRKTFTNIYFPSDVKRTGVSLPYHVIRIEGLPTGVVAAKQIILKIAAHVERYSDKTLEADQLTEMKLEKEKELPEWFESVQVNFSQACDSSCDLLLHGGRGQDDFCTALPQIIDVEEGKHVEVLYVDKEIVCHVFGHRGATLRNIREKTNTWIKIIQQSTDCSAFFIVGKRENVGRARKWITDVTHKMTLVHTRVNATTIPMHRTGDLEGSQEEKNLHIHYESIEVDSMYLPKVIGNHAAQIAKLAEKHDVNILLPDKCHSKLQNGNSITIVGSKCNVKAATDNIREMVKEIDARISEWVKIDRSVHGQIIGYKGRRISKLQTQFDVRVQFPKSEEQGELVKIYGTKENVEKAKCRIVSMESYYMYMYTHGRPCEATEELWDSPGFKDSTNPNDQLQARHLPVIATNASDDTGTTTSK